MFHIRTIIVSSVALMTIGLPAYAQEEVTTGTGATATGATTGTGAVEADSLSAESIKERAAQQEWEERVARSKDFRNKVLESRNTIKTLRAQRANNLKKRSEHRAQCRVDIAKASTLSRFYAALRCYRAELSLTLERLRKERDLLEQMAGISDDMRWLTFTRLDLLTDAIAVVVNAIDSDVYASEEELAEVKANLLENYRKPYWLMRTRLRADKLLTWTSNIITRIAIIVEQEELEDRAAGKLGEALDCLTTAEELLEPILSALVASEAQDLLAEAHLQMHACTPMLRDAYAMQKGTYVEPGQEVIEEEVEEKVDPGRTIGRRLRRRFGENLRVNEDTKKDIAKKRAEELERRLAEKKAQEENKQEAVDEPFSRRLLRRLGEEYRINED